MEVDSEALDLFEERKSSLLDDDEQARYEVARGIARLGREIIPRVIDLAHHDLPRFRDMACYILGQVGFLDHPDSLLLTRYSDGIPTLVELARKDNEAEVRAAAVSALGFHGDPATLPVVIDAASDASEEVRFSAALALDVFPSGLFEEQRKIADLRSPAINALLKLTHDPDDDVRNWATFALHNMDHDTPEVRARFWELLDDSYDDVRGEAAAGLGKFGDRTFIPRLQEILKGEWTRSCHFEAAEYLADPSLLPEVLAAARAWEGDLEEGERQHSYITSAIESLQKVAKTRVTPAESGV